MKTLAVAARTPDLREALNKQSYDNWEVVDEADGVLQSGGFSVFSGVARYYLVSFDDEALGDGLATRGTLLYWMVRAEVDQPGVLLLESSAGGYAGAILTASAFRGHEAIPRRATLAADLIDHTRNVGASVGALLVTEKPIAKAPALPLGETYRAGLPACDGAHDDGPETAPVLSACTSNEIYGDATILRAYCGVEERLPIVGRLQHGWEPGPGLIIEGDGRFDRYYVWSSLAKDRLALARVSCGDRLLLGDAARAALHQKVVLIPIGAPYLYLPGSSDPGPVPGDWLLAVPGHGIVASPTRARPWAAYLEAVREFASASGFGHVTVLIYAEDDTPEGRAAIRDFGFVPASCGLVDHAGYLFRVRSFIRQHTAVTSDRVCTAGMYALYESRPFHVVGAGTVVHDPPDAYADLVADPAWIARNYPGISAGGFAGRAEALAELGEKRPRGDLRRLLYSWVWEGA